MNISSSTASMTIGASWLMAAQSPTGSKTVQEALRTIGQSTSTTVSVQDSAQNIQKMWDRLSAVAGRISSVSLTDMSERVSISAQQFNNGRALVTSLAADGMLHVSGTVNQLSTIANDRAIQAVDVADTHANVSSLISSAAQPGFAFTAVADKLERIRAIGGANTFTVDAAQYNANPRDLLSKLPPGARFNIVGAAVGDVSDLAEDKQVRSISVRDNIQNINDGIDELQRFAPKVKTVTNTSVDNDLKMSAADANRNSAILRKISMGYDLVLYGAMAEVARTDPKLKVSKVIAQDTAANITKQMRTLNTLVASGRLDSIELTDPENAITLASRDIARSATTLSKITSSYSLQISNPVTVSQFFQAVEDLQNFGVTQVARKLEDVAIVDTAAAVNSLKGISLPGWTDSIASIRVTNGGPVAVDPANIQYIQKFDRNTTFDVGSNLSVQQFLEIGQLYKLKPTAVHGSAQTVQDNFSSLSRMKGSIDKIFLSDTRDTEIALSQSQINANSDLLKKIEGRAIFKASDGPLLLRDGNLKSGFMTEHWRAESGNGNALPNHFETDPLGNNYIRVDYGANAFAGQDLNVMDLNARPDSKYLLSFNVSTAQDSGRLFFGLGYGNTMSNALSQGFGRAKATWIERDANEAGRVNFEFSVFPNSSLAGMKVFFNSEFSGSAVSNISLLRIN